MYIVVIGWMYVVLMMSIVEDSVVAGIMTFLMYGVVPLAIILYLTGGRQRRRNRALAKKQADDSNINSTVQPDAGSSINDDNPGAKEKTPGKAKQQDDS
jgi:hypothetical protein